MNENIGIDSESGGVLVGVRSSAFEHVHVNSVVEKTGSRHDSFENLIKATTTASSKELLKKQSENIIKRCEKCNKACASSPLFVDCNSCGAKLPNKETTSDNILSAFCFGIKGGAFPYTASLRYQTAELMVFDDLLALSTCHLLVLPTTYHIPDWRFLLLRPKEGLELINSMQQAAEKVLEEQFLQNKSWRDKILHPKFREASADTLKNMVLAGMNLPPSQFQLHLQYILPPLLPYQYHLYKQGVHAAKNRFFPIQYIRSVLETGKRMGVTKNTDVTEIIQFYEEYGVSYEEIHKEVYDNLGNNHCQLANWRAEDFTALLKDGEVRDARTDEKLDKDKKKVIDEDKLALQNYGRPYLNGKPDGTYYKYARPKPMDEWK